MTLHALLHLPMSQREAVQFWKWTWCLGSWWHKLMRCHKIIGRKRVDEHQINMACFTEMRWVEHSKSRGYPSMCKTCIKIYFPVFQADHEEPCLPRAWQTRPGTATTNERIQKCSVYTTAFLSLPFPHKFTKDTEMKSSNFPAPSAVFQVEQSSQRVVLHPHCPQPAFQ